MSFKSGFFNSLNGDRKYYASDFSNLIDSLVIDGVFASIGTAFTVEATSGYKLNVGVGKAWFNGTWSYNDEVMSITAPRPELLLDRIDAIVLEVNTMDSVRNNSISYITGTPASTPVRPTLTKEELVHQYPLCYIYRKASSSEITQADITNMVGTEDTPFVTGILQTISLDVLLGQWRDQLDQFVVNKENEVDAWLKQMKTDLANEQRLLDEWIASEQADFLAWYQSMKDQLSKDAAGNLLNKIDKNEIKNILLSGFVDGSKEFSDDGLVITSTASDGRVLTKTFSSDFSTMTTVLSSSSGEEIARMVKTFDSGGKLINATVTYS